jgi:hypothetical protein
VREVVGEEHQQRQAQEQQGDGDPDGESRVLVDPLPARDTDLEQAARGIGERPDEHAEHDLVRAVAQEVAQQPGRELRGRQLQRDHGQAQQQRDDRDHGPGNADQQPAGVIRGALKGKKRVLSDVHPRQQGAQQQCQNYRDRGQQP